MTNEDMLHLDKEDFNIQPVFAQNSLKRTNFYEEQNSTQTHISSQKTLLDTNNLPQGCKCKTSKCLRLHCSCFQANGKCSPSCRCTDCLNNDDHTEVREFVIKKTIQINKVAFGDKLVDLPEGLFVREGCNCKERCDQKYCGCKKGGAKCSNHCRCANCVNSKVELDQQVLSAKF